MNKVLLALFLALTIIPAGAIADTPNAAPPAPTAAQREQFMKTMESFHQQAEQLHMQTRSQILNSLTPAHRTAVANIIGNLAISPNPDVTTASRQLDAILSQGEQQRILAADTSLHTQMKSLHERMRAQFQAMMPPGAPRHDMNGGPNHQHNQQQRPRPDAGTVLLMMLNPKPMGMGMGHHWGGGPRR